MCERWRESIRYACKNVFLYFDMCCLLLVMYSKYITNRSYDVMRVSFSEVLMHRNGGGGRGRLGVWTVANFTFAWSCNVDKGATWTVPVWTRLEELVNCRCLLYVCFFGVASSEDNNTVTWRWSTVGMHTWLIRRFFWFWVFGWWGRTNTNVCLEPPVLLFVTWAVCRWRSFVLSININTIWMTGSATSYLNSLYTSLDEPTLDPQLWP